jgi:hypothetical protein
LSAFTHLWNPLGFPSLHIDEGYYMRKAMFILDGTGIDPLARYDHPYFGQIFLAGALGIIGYPDSLLNPSDTNGSSSGDGSSSDDNILHSVQMLYLAPRVLMGLLAVSDTFLIYKITERRYHNRNVALIAAILFAVMPYGWLFRRIFLETIQVPFLLTSILLAVYLKDSLKIIKDKNSNSNSKNTLRSKTISMILLSGASLGLSIFTKVPVFTIIPLVGFLIYTNTNSNDDDNNNNTNGRHRRRRTRLRNLGLWFIPVILIPLIWPAHAMIIGEFDQWIHGVLWQTTGRPSSPLSGTLKTFLQIDPILFVLSIAGLIYAAIKRDFFLLLWVIPFLIFLYFIDFVSSFHLIPLVPAFCIAASRFIVELPSKIKIIKKYYNIQQILPFAIISGIIIFGLVSTTMLITTNVNSSMYKAQAVLIQKLPNKEDEDTNNTNAVTLVASPIYFPMPRHGFDKAFYERSYLDERPLESERYIVVADREFMSIMSGTNNRPSTILMILMKSLYENSQTIDTLVPDDKTKYKLNNYPYSSMRQTPAAKEIEIRSSIANAQLANDVKPSNTTTTGSSKQTGTPDNDNIRGSGKNDIIVGLAGNDIISGQAGNDNINGGKGDDYIIGGTGNDTLVGGAGVDVLEGNAGRDNIDGSEGNDYLIGDQTEDTLKGSAGNDTLIGGPGADTLAGGLDQDNYICGPGNDIVLDFNATEGDIRSNDCEAAATAP